MEITPFQNGTHSLAMGLRNLQDYLADPQNQFSLKGAILGIHHGLETLFKDVLFQRNPIFLLSEKGTIKQVVECYKKFYEGKNHFLFDDEITITPLEALKRLRELNFGTISERDYQGLKGAYENLNTLRNQLQHFAIKLDPQAVVKIFGSVTPKAVKYIDSCYNPMAPAVREGVLPHIPPVGMEHLFRPAGTVSQQITKFYADGPALIELLQGKYDVMLNEAISKFKGKIVSAVSQSIKIESHGKVGAPPYYPTITLNGWINASLDPHRNANGSSKVWNPSSAYYTGQVEITDAVLTGEPHEFELREFSQSIAVTAEIAIEDIPQVLNIDGYSDYIEYLRDSKVLISLNIHYTGQARNTTRNIMLEQIDDLNGELIVSFSSGMFGDPAGTKKIEISQRIQLHKENTKLELHAWGGIVDPINVRHMLALSAEGQTDLIF